MPGGDYGFAHNPHGRNAWDFELFQDKFGFEPAEILAAATRDGGAIMGMADELGLIKPGYIADLVLVDGDPLRHIRLFQDKNKLTLIMKEGRLHKRPDPHRAAHRIAAE
jgi:imidazolonepropionase-like amidohydrolase